MGYVGIALLVWAALYALIIQGIRRIKSTTIVVLGVTVVTVLFWCPILLAAGHGILPLPLAFFPFFGRDRVFFIPGTGTVLIGVALTVGVGLLIARITRSALSRE